MENLVNKITSLLTDKKAIDTKVIDIHEKSTLADYMIVTSGTSSTHIKSLADHLEEELKKLDIVPSKIEGKNSNSWILMDYGEALVHIFTQQDREHYNLEDLWGKVR